MRAQAGHGGVRVRAGQLELDVPVELGKALVAVELSVLRVRGDAGGQG